MNDDHRGSLISRFATRHAAAIVFVVLALCLAGAYSAFNISSSMFPQTDFPRVVILVDNGVMPGDEMMATITRPIEEAMKDIPGVTAVRTATGQGSAEVSIFFNWQVDMVESEIYVLARLSQIRGGLPETATTQVHRLTFAAFPVIGVSLTSKTRDITHLWETARYDLKPRFLRIPDVARVDLVGGRATEYHVVVDPMRLQALNLSLNEATSALEQNNLVAPSGMIEENHFLYLTVVDGRLRGPEEVAELVVKAIDGHPVRIGDFARVERGPEPVFNIVTADGEEAVLLNIRSQPDGSTLDIAKALDRELDALRRDLPPDMKLASFYDQSLIVRESVRSVWEAIVFGLMLSAAILYLFLRSWGSTAVAVLVIPMTVLITLVAMKLSGLTYNLMTLGGIAAAIGMVIDDAIVVVETIHTKLSAGMKRIEAVESAVTELLKPLLASTLTPVVVFIPLAFLDGITGVFFRALALTMVVSLLTSLVLAVTATPSLASRLMKKREPKSSGESAEGGPIIFLLNRLYERLILVSLRHRWTTLGLCLLVLFAGLQIYLRLGSEFLPPMDEGGFVIDYEGRPGTSLAETDQMLRRAEEILLTVPEVESYSRRTGARLALAIAEPHTGDFLVKLKRDRARSTEDVISDLRRRFNAAVPGLAWEFPGIMGDLIGDLMWSPAPIEVKLFSTDIDFLKAEAPRIKEEIEKVEGVVDAFNGLVYAGNSIHLRVRDLDAARFHLTTQDIADAVGAAMLGKIASSILEGDRLIDIRVLADKEATFQLATLRRLPLRTPGGELVALSQVCDVVEEPGQLELRREDMRQLVAVTARLENRDLGGAMAEIRDRLSRDPSIPPGALDFGGLWEQQQQSFRNLLIVLIMAIVLVFTVLLIEFRSFAEPLAIVFGAILALFGSVTALWVTDTSMNVVSFLGTIIGVGIVAKNGILMLDLVEYFRGLGFSTDESIVRSGRRRLRPVLMTSLAAMLGLLPLAWGVGSGADMLRPLAIAVMGAICISVLFSLIATPTIYRIFFFKRKYSFK
jgi:CzcA family heavy metal efflux pump